MNAHRRIAAVSIVAVIVLAGLGLATQIIGPAAVDVCVAMFEDQSGGGDTFATCNTSPSQVKNSNLTTVTTGLHNGCNRGLNQSSSWSDCISSASIANLPANQSVRFYQDTGYSGQILCYSTPGSHLIQLNVPATNDKTSSFRILGGVC